MVIWDRKTPKRPSTALCKHFRTKLQHTENNTIMSNKTKYSIDSKGFYGEFGGAYVPEILYKCVTDLQQAYLPIIESDSFQQEYRALLRDYVGRPSPLYEARRMSEKYG